jgi:hypothetical protein
VTTLRPASSADDARWLLDPVTDWRDLVRFGPPGYEFYLRIKYETSDPRGHDHAEAPTMRRALSLLQEHTATSESAYAAIWAGWASELAPTAPRLPIPHREMLLFTGPVSAMRDAPAIAWGLDPGSVHVEPNLVWPQDRAWLLASEVDEDIEFTVGCSTRAANALRAALGDDARVATYGEDTPLHRE